MIITQQEIDRLRAIVTHADLEDLAEFVAKSGEADPTTLNEDLKAYLRHFAKPTYPNYPCLACGAYICGFVWGLSHGSGHCKNCGWPATLYHFIKDRDGKDIATIRGCLLQAHPDDVSVKPLAKLKK